MIDCNFFLGGPTFTLKIDAAWAQECYRLPREADRIAFWREKTRDARFASGASAFIWWAT